MSGPRHVIESIEGGRVMELEGETVVSLRN